MIKNCFWCNKELSKKNDLIFCQYCFFNFDKKDRAGSYHRCSWLDDENAGIQLIEPKTNFLYYQSSKDIVNNIYKFKIIDLITNNDIFSGEIKGGLNPQQSYNFLMKFVKMKAFY